MLQWVEREVSSPYGDVATLHWAVADKADRDETNAEEDDGGTRGGHTHNNTSHTASGSGSSSSHNVCSADDNALESAENQLGAVLWNSNTAALEYLHKHVFTISTSKAAKGKAQGPCLRGRRVIELGAGVGCLGIALAMAGAAVVITDLKELLPLMAHNVRRNADRVARRSAGAGSCAAQVWKWGPSVSLNLKKRLKRERRTTSDSNSEGAVQLAANAMRAALQPSSFWQTCQESLRGSAVDYVVLCDALYGNPQDWPQLLYTLSEILEANPHRCQVINFCEQRVNEVEAGFLRLLDAENAKPPVVQDARRPLETICAELMESHTATKTTTTSSSSSGNREERESLSPATMLEYILRLKRGNYVWDYRTEVVAEQESELHMTIRATRLRWRLRDKKGSKE